MMETTEMATQTSEVGSERSFSPPLIALHCEEGRIVCWGCGEFGQHCHGNIGDVSSDHGVVTSMNGQKIKFVACGSSHTIIVTESNEVYSCGNGKSGQLGCGKDYKTWTVNKLELMPGVKKNPTIAGVKSGGRHTIIWLKNGNAFSFGNNFFAQLGYDFRLKAYKQNQYSPHPIRILSQKRVKQVACGDKHTVFLTDAHQIALVGDNNYGQLGNNMQAEAETPLFHDNLPPITYIACGTNHNLALDENGEIWCWGSGKPCGSRNKYVAVPTKCVPFRPNVCQLAGGQVHSVALTANGHVYTWGSGRDGQLGHGEDVKFVTGPRLIEENDEFKDKIAFIEAKELFSAAITDAGRLWMWGKNNHVISNEKANNTRFFKPRLVNLGDNQAAKISCGAWHAAVVTGLPAINSNRGNTEVQDDENNDLDVLEVLSIQSASEDNQDSSSDPFERQKTSMTIEDFYAPTPQQSSRLSLRAQQELSSQSNQQELSVQGQNHNAGSKQLKHSNTSNRLVNNNGLSSFYVLPSLANQNTSDTESASNNYTTNTNMDMGDQLPLLTERSGDNGRHKGSQFNFIFPQLPKEIKEDVKTLPKPTLPSYSHRTSLVDRLRNEHFVSSNLMNRTVAPLTRSATTLLFTNGTMIASSGNISNKKCTSKRTRRNVSPGPIVENNSNDEEDEKVFANLKLGAPSTKEQLRDDNDDKQASVAQWLSQIGKKTQESSVKPGTSHQHLPAGMQRSKTFHFPPRTKKDSNHLYKEEIQKCKQSEPLRRVADSELQRAYVLPRSVTFYADTKDSFVENPYKPLRHVSIPVKHNVYSDHPLGVLRPITARKSTLSNGSVIRQK